MPEIITQIAIETRIFLIRGKKVMLDKDLAELYDVPTKALNQAVKRNSERFPEEFMFKLSPVRKMNWSQIVTGLHCGNIHTFQPSIRPRNGSLTEQGAKCNLNYDPERKTHKFFKITIRDLKRKLHERINYVGNNCSNCD